MHLDDLLNLPLPDLASRLGPPSRSASTPHFHVLDFDEIDDHDFAWTLVLDSTTRQPLSLTRRFSLPQDFTPLFPPESTIRHQSRGAVARVRPLDPTRSLIGIGRQQLILVHPSVLPRFFPWLKPQAA